MVLDGCGSPLERARACAELGAALRRAGNPVAAREPLRIALDLAHRCGATDVEELALSELRAAGGRPRRRLLSGAGALTPSERRIADLAAAGHRNREIAATLVVTLATVEYHLRNAYRKLGVRSRAQLGEALGVSRRTTALLYTSAAGRATPGAWQSLSSAATHTYDLRRAQPVYR